MQSLHAMRPCEVLGLKWDDFDFKRGVFRIRRNVVHPTRHFPIVGETKTHLSKRELPIMPLALPYLKEAADKYYVAGEFLFGGEKPLTYTQHRQMMKRIMRQMGLNEVSGYTFRHTVITDIYESTHDANIAAAVAGHSKTTTTMNRYAHARKNAAAKGIEALSEAYSMWYDLWYAFSRRIL